MIIKWFDLKSSGKNHVKQSESLSKNISESVRREIYRKIPSKKTASEHFAKLSDFSN